MAHSRWRKRAQAVIESALDDGERLERSGKALYDFVNQQYPFGERNGHPYDIWLSEMQQLRVRLGLEEAKPAPARRKAVESAPVPAEQLGLWGETGA